jgi:glycosyltransferase involved in cell wall biosynthesis
VIVPARNAAALLPETLGAMRDCALPRHVWELIVVNDASTDDTALVATRFADRVQTLEDGPAGPGGARNAGSRLAGGTWLVFIDADVRVHRDTLERIRVCIEEHPEAAALFGAYDDQPAAPGLVSVYRNLLHRYNHLVGAGDAETFWAGCGAVRRSSFVALGGFDSTRYPRPQIEDIELGYRLRDAGSRIILDPSIQGTHLKRWTFSGMIRTDILDRGIPWMRLMLERRGRTRASLNTLAGEKLKVVLTGSALLLLFAAPLTGRLVLTLMSLLAFCLVIVLSRSLLGYMARVRGVGFAIAIIPLHLVHYCCNVVSAAAGVALHVAAGRPRYQDSQPMQV